MSNHLFLPIMNRLFILILCGSAFISGKADAQIPHASQTQVDFYPRLSQIYAEGGHIKNTTNSTAPDTYNVSSASSNMERIGVTVELSRQWSIGLSASAIQSTMSGTAANNQVITGTPHQNSFSGSLNYNFYPFLSVGGFYGAGQGPNSLIYGLTSYPSNSNSQLAGAYGSLSILLNQWLVNIAPSYVYSSSTTNANSVGGDPQFPSSSTSSYLNTANLVTSLSYLSASSGWRYDAGVVTHQVISQSAPSFQMQYASIWYTPFLAINYLTEDRYQFYARGTKEVGYSQMGGNSIVFGIAKNF